MPVILQDLGVLQKLQVDWGQRTPVLVQFDLFLLNLNTWTSKLHWTTLDCVDGGLFSVNFHTRNLMFVWSVRLSIV